MTVKKKGKFRWGTLGAVLASVAGVAVTVVSDPAVIQAAAPRVGLSVAVLGAIVAGVKKALTRDEHER